MPNWIVGFETSSTPVSVALFESGSGQLLERRAAVPRERGKVLLPLLLEMLAEAGLPATQIDAYSAGVGPGSYTGVRIGLSLACSLAYAGGKQLRGVSSLTVLAATVDGAAGLEPSDTGDCVRPLVVAANAFRGELFAAQFLPRVPGALWRERLGDEVCVSPAELVGLATAGSGTPGSPLAAGDGVDAYGEQLAAGGLCVRLGVRPTAGHLVCLASHELAHEGSHDPLCLVPVHLRALTEEFRTQ